MKKTLLFKVVVIKKVCVGNTAIGLPMAVFCTAPSLCSRGRPVRRFNRGQ